MQKSSLLKLQFISRTVPPKALREAGPSGGICGGGLKTKRLITEEGEPGRRVLNLTSTGMLAFYFILAVLKVAILQFVLE